MDVPRRALNGQENSGAWRVVQLGLGVVTVCVLLIGCSAVETALSGVRGRGGQQGVTRRRATLSCCISAARQRGLGALLAGGGIPSLRAGPGVPPPPPPEHGCRTSLPGHEGVRCRVVK